MFDIELGNLGDGNLIEFAVFWLRDGWRQRTSPKKTTNIQVVIYLGVLYDK